MAGPFSPRSILLPGYDVAVDVRHLTDRVNQHFSDLSTIFNDFEGEVGSGLEQTIRPSFQWIRDDPSTSTTRDVRVAIEHPEDDSGTLFIWTNKNGEDSPDPSQPPDGSVAYGPTPTVIGPAESALLDEVTYRPGSVKNVYFRAEDSEGRSTSIQGWSLGAVTSIIEPDGTLAPDVVNTDNLVDQLVTTAKIANLAVDTAKLADLVATEAKIATDAISSVKIQNNAIEAPKIAAGAVIAGKIAANAVTAGTIAANAVIAGTIAAGAVTTATLDALAVTTDKLDALSITSDKLAANSVIAGKIAAFAVTAGTIAADAVTAAAINVAQLDAISADVGELTAGQIRNAADTAGILLSGAVPGTWTQYMDLTAAGDDPFIEHPGLTLQADGDADFGGIVSANSFTGASPIFDNNLIVRSGLGGTNTHEFTADGSFGNYVMRRSAGTEQASLFLGAGLFQIATDDTDIHLVTDSGFDMVLQGDEVRVLADQLNMSIFSSPDAININGSGVAGTEANIRWETNSVLSWRAGRGNDTEGRDWFLRAYDSSGDLVGDAIQASKTDATVAFPSHVTTANGPNAWLDASTGELRRESSSSRFKRDIDPLASNEVVTLIDGLRPVTYKSTAPKDDQEREFIGLVAEEVAAIDGRYVHMHNGLPEGVMYSRLVVPLVAVVQELRSRVAQLEAQMN